MAPQIIAEINRFDLDGGSSQSRVTISDFKHLASYNWLENRKPTIAVPGCPPRWCPPSRALQVQPDAGKVFIDQNAEKSPGTPLEPLFRSLFALQPDFDISAVELVTDRNNIRKLLHFVQGNHKGEPFKIKVEVVDGRTMLFTRVSDKTSEVIRSFQGYGHNFEKSHTKKFPGSIGHHRIVSYSFGGLQLIGRFETDGYFPDPESSSTTAKDVATVDPDSVAESLGSLRIDESSPAPEPVSSANSAITLKLDGKLVDFHKTLEIKTRAARKNVRMADVTPQLWISQTPHLVLAYHENGLFDNIEIKDMTVPLHDWETQNQASLHKLSELLRSITSAVERCDSNAATIVYGGAGAVLKIVADKNGRALPEDLYSRWRRTTPAGGAFGQDKENDDGGVKLPAKQGGDISKKTNH